ARCEALTSVVLPNGLQSVGERAFWGCEALTSITLPEALRTVGDEAFGGCERLASVAFPDALRKVGKEAFVDCPSLQTVVLPDGLEKIGKEAFGRFGKKETPWRASKESERQTVPNFTIQSAPGSAAEKYARKNKLRFEQR
ncbi:MAG: leucine-rich repeat domain-containing protein, partial [Thermoguttaceae bacterium]|nr:leucine-rich repeat domain-containing protein [Thermoguttaceae bacterium]